MLIIHFLEFSLFFVIHTGLNLTTSKVQMEWFESFDLYCKLNTIQNVKELNGGQIWFGGLFYRHHGWFTKASCFHDNGSLSSAVNHTINWKITSSCSYKCREEKFYALRGNFCTCLNTTSDLMRVNSHNCSRFCNGSAKNLCGDEKYYTVYEYRDVKSLQTSVSNANDIELCSSNITDTSGIENGNKVVNWTPYWTTFHRQHVLKWSPKKKEKEDCYQMEDLLKVECESVNEGMQYVPMSCKRITCPELCESTTDNTMTEITAKCADINVMKDLSTVQQNVPVISTTASPGTKPLVPANMIKVTVIPVVGVLITIVIAVIVILIFYRRKRKRTKFYSRKSVTTTNCYDMSWSGEGEQTMQMLSNSNRSNNRTNAVPFILQQTQRPGNISLSNYQNPVDMDNQYKRLDFTMQNDEHKSLKEVHNDYSMHYNKGTGSPTVNTYGSKFSKRPDFQRGRTI